MNSFDVAVEALLSDWAPRIGRPTCGPGCSRCCERMTVIISSAEALRLLDETQFRETWSDRADALRRTEFTGADAANNALLDLGSCVFLTGDGRCGVYPNRPDACRACHVWHDATVCGREDYDMCTPAELIALRVDRIHELMLEELSNGRRPFWGRLLPMVAALDEHRDRYLAGEDLCRVVEPHWTATELIEFPGEPGRIRNHLEDERARLAAVFAGEENPMGFPRASDARDRTFLDAFPLD